MRTLLVRGKHKKLTIDALILFFTFAMRYCKQTSDEDQMLEGVKMSPFLEKAAKRVRILAGINVKI
ncbi:hypothetical protein KZ774_25175 [Escherichia coli]|nr:hypothetical protein [Escherichia coli]